jgi:16S rRNA (cytosine967-C5)-methyltransferase
METDQIPATSRSLAADSLSDFESGPAYADEVLSRHLSLSTFRGSDRALAADLFWGAIRWRGRLDSVIAPVFRGDYRRANPSMRILLRMGAYQLFCQDRIPDHAAVSQTVEIAIQKHGRKAGGLTNAILRRLARERERWSTPPDGSDDAARLAFFHSHPRWIVQQLVDRFGLEVAEIALKMNNERAPLTICVNDPDTDAALERLTEFLNSKSVHFSPSELKPGYIRLETPSIGQIQHLLDSGEITVQDESAGLAVQLLSPEPGERVLDACASPGGKTIAMNRLMKGEGELIAIDITENRVSKLKGNIERVHADHITILMADVRELKMGDFDRVLCDVPCSSTGLLRKQPDVRWRRKSHHIAEQHRQQVEILNRASDLVKPGGVLVYSTCSVLPSENQEVITGFLKTHPEFHKEDARGFLPEAVVSPHGDMETFTHVHGTDGAFASRLRRSP